jgi:hypothetical protein
MGILFISLILMALIYGLSIVSALSDTLAVENLSNEN